MYHIPTEPDIVVKIDYAIAPSAGAVKYSDCISSEGLDTLKEYSRYNIKQSDR